MQFYLLSFPSFRLPALLSNGNNLHILYRLQLLLDLDKQQSLRGLPLHVIQVHEPVALLQTIEADAGPCADAILGVPLVFDLESVERINVSQSKVRKERCLVGGKVHRNNENVVFVKWRSEREN
jgi:hypothetical protein